MSHSVELRAPQGTAPWTSCEDEPLHKRSDVHAVYRDLRQTPTKIRVQPLTQQEGILAQSSQASAFQPGDQQFLTQQAPQPQTQRKEWDPAQNPQASVLQTQQFSQAFPPKQPVTQAEPLDKCAVADYEQIQCGQPGISAAECEAINCCFNGPQCYYGKAVTIQCIQDGQFVVVVARDFTLPSLSLDTVRLLGGNDPPCAPVGSTPSFAIYQFPVTACGTSMIEDNGYVVYENRMTSSYEVGIGQLGSITRDSHFELFFQCRYSGTAVEALAVEVNTVPPPPPVAAPGPLRVELRLANGQCVTKGCSEEDAAYTSYYSDSDYPVTKVLRQPVYVEVHLLERTDPNIFLMLGHCWGTSSPDPLSLPQWDLLVNGCPYQDDRYLTTLVPVDGSSGLQFPTHYKRFIVKMFTFVDPASLAPLQGTVFIHCSTSVCHPSSFGSCEQSCIRQKRDVGENIEKTVVSSGGIFFIGGAVPAADNQEVSVTPTAVFSTVRRRRKQSKVSVVRFPVTASTSDCGSQLLPALPAPKATPQSLPALTTQHSAASVPLSSEISIVMAVLIRTDLEALFLLQAYLHEGLMLVLLDAGEGLEDFTQCSLSPLPISIAASVSVEQHSTFKSQQPAGSQPEPLGPRL
ncbi:zona pellucida sperm-binding protein 4-like [Xyrauchen texanus]|uniref:zona pellucida sperm-binding protein 4-like n=1 Tax=Xyrauchen texanus TaxID=154827 RepID=UPI0022429F2B|nr:zona pellucida sperm-binding protein 4-like [Xyrauchen texanus]